MRSKQFRESILSIMAVVVIGCTLTGCGKEKVEPNPQDTTEEQPRIPPTPRRVPARDTIIEVDGIAFQMIYVPGGTYQMGSTTTPGAEGYDPDSDPDEQPQHRVTLSSFLISQEEVSQLLFFAAMRYNPSETVDQNLPVHCVSYTVAQKFIDSLFWHSAYPFRMPTEAEWEYAARGGANPDTSYYFAGSNNLNEVSWNSSNSDDKVHQSGLLAPNSLGIYDMTGNLMEWCIDWYGNYSATPQVNPVNNTPLTTMSLQQHIVRGGNFTQTPYYLRNTYRQRRFASYEGRDVGIRLVLPVTE